MDDAYGFSWRWAGPAIAVVAATGVVGILRYPELPERIPLHLNAAGAVDREVARSPLAAFAIVGIQVLLLVLLAGASSAKLRRLSSSRDFATYGREMLLFAASVQVSLMLGAFLVWRLIPPGWWVLPMVLLPTLAGVLYMLVQNMRQPAPGTPGTAPAGPRRAGPTGEENG